MHLESQVQRGCAGSLSSLYVHFSNLPAQPRLADLTERLYHTRSCVRVCVCDPGEGLEQAQKGKTMCHFPQELMEPLPSPPASALIIHTFKWKAVLPRHQPAVSFLPGLRSRAAE